jgi:hypothetical protein
MLKHAVYECETWSDGIAVWIPCRDGCYVHSVLGSAAHCFYQDAFLSYQILDRETSASIDWNFTKSRTLAFAVQNKKETGWSKARVGTPWDTHRVCHGCRICVFSWQVLHELHLTGYHGRAECFFSLASATLCW